MCFITQTIDPCAHCNVNTLQLFGYYTSAEEIGRQINDLINGACPKMEDVEGCETNVRDWWPGMNAIYFNSVDIVSGICLGMDACGQGL